MVSGINLLHVSQLITFLSVYVYSRHLTFRCLPSSTFLFLHKLKLDLNKNLRGQIEAQEAKLRQVLWQM